VTGTVTVVHVAGVSSVHLLAIIVPVCVLAVFILLLSAVFCAKRRRRKANEENPFYVMQLDSLLPDIPYDPLVEFPRDWLAMYAYRKSK
jgi:hypothetical protein